MASKRSLLLLAFLSCVATSSASLPAPIGRCWLVIDFDAISCPACLDQILSFCRALPAEVLEERVMGIVVFGRALTAEEGARRRRIAEIKWDGIRRANGLRFPSVLDDGPVVRSWLNRGAAKIVCFDGKARMLREYDLPLVQRRFDELLAILVD